mmetsp:Transcript_22706/g.56024  ORF Transcript_22706/g.56024 Transcript_22706/m.56024 type:complete len:168 (+) Transcript_22706:670-1173(+)
MKVDSSVVGSGAAVRGAPDVVRDGQRFGAKSMTWNAAQLDPDTAARLKRFYARNKQAQETEAVSIREQSQKYDEATLQSLQDNISTQVADDAEAVTASVSEKLAALDVFSPDVRSLRWKEFEAMLEEGGIKTLDHFRQQAAGKRGKDKAMTLAGVKQTPGQAFGTLH